MVVILSHSTHSLMKDLRDHRACVKGKKRYLVCDAVDNRVISLLLERGFKEAEELPYNQGDKDLFLSDYVNVIGVLGQHLNSKLWWATDISSKNRFTSRLPMLFHQFLRVLKFAKEQGGDDLLYVLNPPWVIVGALKKALAQEGVPCRCRQSLPEKWADVSKTRARRILAAFYMALRTIARRCYSTAKLGFRVRGALPGDAPCYVIKTFIYDSSFDGQGHYRDAFFGSLPKFLMQRKQVFIFADILGNYRYCIDQICKCSDAVIRPLESFVTLKDIGLCLSALLFAKLRVKEPVALRGYDVSDIVNQELSRTHNGIPFYQFLHFGATRLLSRHLRMESFLFTYENNPWERMCMMAVKSQAPQTTVMGYQHTVVPHASANMFISSHERGILPMPDRILTVGEAPKEIMERYGDYTHASVEVGCGLRFEYLFQLPVSQRQKRGNILLALEGIFDVYHLVNYCLEQLKEADAYRVRIRTHPVLPMEQMAGKLFVPVESVPHFSISKSKALKEDLDWADVVIYWGSTVALEALCLGKPVIHYDMGSILNYDPLFQCGEFKWVVTKRDSLRKAILVIDGLSDEEFTAKQKKAKDYLNRYFFPVTDDTLSRFLN